VIRLRLVLPLFVLVFLLSASGAPPSTAPVRAFKPSKIDGALRDLLHHRSAFTDDVLA